MKVKEALININKIIFPGDSPGVVGKSIDFLTKNIPDLNAEVVSVNKDIPEGKAFLIGVASSNQLKKLGIKKPLKQKDTFIYFLLRKNGTGYCVSSHSCFLYSFIYHLTEQMGEWNIDRVYCGKWIKPTFTWQRVSYDYFLTQQGRIQYKLDREAYIAELARFGFTHIEVNGLAFPKGLESGPKGETYPMFYTYCPALDQFVSSQLNKGLYPDDYLSANLTYLKQNARWAIEYGLVPGLLCFEPRSVPEKFFEKYPMLRGARVDHPFRSFKPRYNMTITHPLVREHYAELIRKLMQEVPELEFINIWTNDSGAGFEHTKSLYVGRNGGAYLIREWKDDKEISRLAGENALRFFKALRDEAQKINPEFRVITRMESFYGEHETVWKGLEDGIDVETSSLMARGWEIPYNHPSYPDSNSINAGTIYQVGYHKEESELADELRKRGSTPHLYFSAGQHCLFDPLMGIPYPNLVYQRLTTFWKNEISHLSVMGGISIPGLVPFNINHEIIRSFQYNPELEIESEVKKIAAKWAGEKWAQNLVNAWKFTEDAILAFPNVIPLYSTFGFTWYRLWARPLVPDIEKIPQEQRNYYEEFMCTTPHNPNNVDLSRDVLFQLTTPEKSKQDLERIDSNVWEPIDKAINQLERIEQKLSFKHHKDNVIQDQLIRIKALKCWMMTQRNVAAWIGSVYGYINTADEKMKMKERRIVEDLIQKEIDNSNVLSGLLDSGIEFMAMTDQGETELVYGKNLKELLKQRVRLMEKHIYDEPFIDHDYMERKAGEIS